MTPTEKRAALFESIAFGIAAVTFLVLFVDHVANGHSALLAVAFGLGTVSLGMLTASRVIRYRHGKPGSAADS